MAEKYGFVYLLAHPDMPDVYKVGCSERSPNARLAELNSSTSIPQPFTMLCAIEVADPFGVEAQFHKWLKEYRISSGREFFRHGNLRWLAGLYAFYEDAYAYIEYGIQSTIFDESIEKGWDSCELINPYRKKSDKKESEESKAAANDESQEAA